MGDLFQNLALGFSVALSVQNLLLALTGCLVGTLVGVLPGVGPIATITMLLPVTFGLDPAGAIIMLAGIYYGAQYGGSTTAILVNIPGEVTAVVTTLDGHEMAKQGRAGAALGVAAIGSFFAGMRRDPGRSQRPRRPSPASPCCSAPPSTSRSWRRGSCSPSSWRAGSILKAIAMILVGLLLARWAPISRPAWSA